MLTRIRARLGIATDASWKAIDDLADSFALPREWIVCGHCGAQYWRLPPHGLDPCPTVVQLADAAGIKIDADRAATIRMGVSAQEMWETLRKQLGDLDDE